jgi:hypothetical protein
MALNAEKATALVEQRKNTHPEYGAKIKDINRDLLAALGDDEQPIVDFIKSADSDTKDYLSELADNLYGKFHTETMDRFLEETWPDIWHDPVPQGDYYQINGGAP